jgi:UDP-N-acetylmuramate dehydrogenase
VAALIEQARLSGAKVGGAQVSERDPNYVIAHPGATARYVLRLMELIKSQVLEHFQVELEPDLSIW